MARRGNYWPTVRRQGKRLFVWLVVILVVLITVFLVVVSTPYQGTPESIAAAEDDERVTVEQTEMGYVLEPAEHATEAGLVFYPGGLVHPDAYVGSLATVSREANVTVVIPEMPFNLAVVDYGLGQSGLRSHAGDTVMEEHSEIDEWYVGGHSLGGAMACRYAEGGADVEGLVLYGAYCDVDISDHDLAVLSVAGGADTVLNWDAYEKNRENLPDTAREEVLDGLNHTQFGSYTSQDEPSGTSYEVAHQRLNDVSVPWFREQIASETR